MQEVILRTDTLGIPVDALPALESVETLIEEALSKDALFVMTFANPATAVLAQREPALVGMLREFDLVAPDGIGMALAVQWLHKTPVARVSFDTTSLAPWLMRFAAERSLRIVLCGGRARIAEKAATELHRAYRGVNIVGWFDGYSDTQETITAIRQIEPDIVICGMGTPKQEAFLLALAASGWTGLGFTCGGFLDQLTERGINYYPAIINKCNLRWAYRLVMEPKRLWRRYLLDYPAFAAELCKALLHEGKDGR